VSVDILRVRSATSHWPQAAGGSQGRDPEIARAVLLDIGGRKVLALHPGANGVSRLAPGVCFVRDEPRTRRIIVAE
jgi:hypothetical protein